MNQCTPPRLHVLLIGASHELEMLRLILQKHPCVDTVTQAGSLHHAWGEIRSQIVNTIIIDIQEFGGDIDSLAYGVFRVRCDLPEMVFAFLCDEEEFSKRVLGAPQSVKARLNHYYRVARSLKSPDIHKLVERAVQWHRTLADKRPNVGRYKYDVALSFAGEQRQYADELATILRAKNIRVFYDTFEQAELWGKNLFERLFAIYSEESRYCIMFVSAAYASKMWTVHERRSAQERVLKERDAEYLLPVRVDETRLPGLPDSVAYLSIKVGIGEIARLFVRKLGVTLSDGRRDVGR